MAGSTNFLPFNPAKNNMVDDATYTASAYRTGGIPATPGAAPSIVHNKLFYQASTMVSALAQSLADKGYTVSDAVFADLVTVLNSLANTVGFAMTGAINEAMGANIASAATCNIGAATGNYVRITGTTTITNLGTVQAGTRRIVNFTEALTLTHNAASLILPGGANISTAAGDCAVFISLGNGNWRCVGYMRADGTPVVGSVPPGTVIYIPRTSPPLGYLKANGALISRSTYWRLWAEAQVSGALVAEASWSANNGCYPTGNGTSTFRLPDLRGEFFRSLDDGRGIDDRTIGSWQADLFKAHAHTLLTNTTADDGGGYVTGGDTGSSDTSRSTSTVGGTETRPRNVALLACIKY